MEQTDSDQRWRGRRIMVERGEGTSQRTCMNDPWTWTRVWKLTVGARDGVSGGGQRGENWDNCNRIKIKYLKNK